MNYSEFSIDDFVSDKYFVESVKNPTKESGEFWDNWIINHPNRKNDIEEAKKIVWLMSFEQTEPSDQVVNGIWNRIDTTLAEEKAIKKTLDATTNVFPWLRVAAVFLAIFCCSLVGYWVINSRSSYQISTRYGEVKTVVLPDHSTVYLNANTVIKYGKNWNAHGEREVWLDGEAFFSVYHKKNNQKFIVHTKNLNIEVIGTKFNVNNRRNNVKVVLSSGKVKLELNQKKENEQIYMKPGEYVELTGGKELIKRNVDPEIFSAWRDQQLVFVASTLSEIIKVLEDNYGYVIVVKNPEILQYKFTGTTPSSEVNILLKTLSEAFDISIKRKGNTLVFKRNKN